MQRWKFGLEFKREAVKLIRDRGVSTAPASRDLGVHANVLCNWVKDYEADPAHGLSRPWPDEARTA